MVPRLLQRVGMIHSATVRYCSHGSAASERQSSVVPLETVLAILLLHMPLALLMSQYPTVAGVHAVSCLLIGMVWATSGASLDRLANVAAYIVGAEVLWRMTRAPVFWESGKYAVAVILLLGIQRTRPLKATNFPIIFFALLVPSVLLTISSKASLDWIRQEISFNLSGPLALAVCAAFFSRVQLTTAQVQRMLIAFLSPLVGIIAVVLFKASTVEELGFSGTSSSKLLSGGYGPNQVSSVLGLGALAAFLIVVLFVPPKQRGMKWLMLGLSILLAAQSALTFSRNGLYLALISAFAAAVFLLRDARARTTLLAASGILCVVGYYVVIPRLDTFTEGALTRRFADPSLTGRDQIMQADVNTWAEHFWLGVGPGMAGAYRARYFRAASAHTEFTRLVAEHGALGLAALGLLMVFGWQAVWRVKSPRWRAFVAAMVTFSLLYMVANAMRLVLPAFCFGLAFASPKDE